jgi:hypothetical protein
MLAMRYFSDNAHIKHRSRLLYIHIQRYASFLHENYYNIILLSPYGVFLIVSYIHAKEAMFAHVFSNPFLNKSKDIHIIELHSIDFFLPF